VKSAAEKRKAIEARKGALKKEEDALVLSEAALKKQEVELVDEKKRSQREAKRLMEFMPQEVREWLEFVVEDEPERKRQKVG
jgi:F420-0:gamma-glutamyl ligase-like protein